MTYIATVRVAGWGSANEGDWRGAMRLLTAVDLVRFSLRWEHYTERDGRGRYELMSAKR